MVAVPLTFPDTANHWSNTYVSVLASAGIVGGYDDGKFHPEREMTGLLALVVGRAAGGITEDDARLVQRQDIGILAVHEGAGAGVGHGAELQSLGRHGRDGVAVHGGAGPSSGTLTQNGVNVTSGSRFVLSGTSNNIGDVLYKPADVQVADHAGRTGGQGDGQGAGAVGGGAGGMSASTGTRYHVGGRTSYGSSALENVVFTPNGKSSTASFNITAASGIVRAAQGVAGAVGVDRGAGADGAVVVVSIIGADGPGGGRSLYRVCCGTSIAITITISTIPTGITAQRALQLRLSLAPLA